MSFKRLVLIYLVANSLIVVFLYFYLLKPVPTTLREINGIEANFPEWQMDDYWMGNGWKGKVLNDSLAELRILSSMEKDEEGEPIFFKEKLLLRREIPVFPRGIYYFTSTPFGYHVMYSFHIGKTAYWLDINSFTKLSKYKELLDAILTNMKVRGKKSEIRLGMLDVHFPWKILRMNSTVFLISTGGILFLSAVFLLLFPVFGSCGNLKGNCYPLSTVKIGKGIFAKARPCCVCIEKENIIIKTRFYKEIRIPTSEADFSLAEKGIIKTRNITIYTNKSIKSLTY